MPRSLAFAALLTMTTVVSAADPSLPACPPGWKVEVVAKVPRLRHPSVVCCAPDGRVFVAEDPMDMAAPSDRPADRILCFHPGGKVTVFAEGLYAVFGMQYLDGKLYVHHTPRFSVFTDDHGVGRNRTDLIHCTNPRPWSSGFNDHIPSNCRLAMDGYLYVSTGDKGVYGAVGADGRAIELHGGGVFRLRPDGTGLEVYCTGTRNHLDVAINDEDELFTYDNTDDGNGWNTRVTHMVDGGFYGYPHDYKPRRPYTLWMMTDYGGGSPTGALAYNEDALPAEYHGNLFLCEWGRSQLLRLRVARDGGTYRVLSRQDFLTKGTTEFRPVGIAVAPDGLSLYVTDWEYGGWKAKAEAGRLLKISYTGPSAAAPRPAWYVPAAMGQPFGATIAELVAALAHPAQSVRLVAQRRLADRGPAAVGPLQALLANAKAPARARWHALWTLDAIDGGKAARPAILAALHDADPSVRRQAARQLGTRRAKEAVGALIALLRDPEPSVGFQAATALGRIGDPAAVGPLRDGLDEPDLFARYARFTALRRIGTANPRAWGAVVDGLADRRSAVRQATGFALRDAYDAELVRRLAALAADHARPAAGRVAALDALAGLAHRPPAWKGEWWGTQPVRTPPPARTIEWPGTPAVLAALRGPLQDADAAVRAAAVRGVQEARDAAAMPLLVDLFRKDDQRAVRVAVLRALEHIPDPAAGALLASVLREPDRYAGLLPEAARAAEKVGGPAVADALAALAGRDAGPDVLVPVLNALGHLKVAAAVPAVARRARDHDLRTAAAAVEALADIGGDPAADALLAVLADPRAELRRAAIAALGALRARRAMPALLRASHAADTRFEAIAALARVPDLRALDAYLDGLGSKNATLREQCGKAVAAIGSQALPRIEAKLDATLLPPEVIAELQRVYGAFQPISNWQILGPFPNPTEDFFPVDRVPLHEEFKDVTGKPTRWRAATAEGPHGRVNLAARMSVNTDVTAYALAEFDSPAERPTELLAGSDDGLVLWLNGKKVFEDLGDRAWQYDQFRIPVTLRAGKNLLLAKITQHSAQWEFSVAYPAPRKGRLFEIVPRQLDPRAYEQFALGHAGNPAHGRKLFFDLRGVACAKCHKVRTEGGDVGPDLASVGAKYNRAQLIESVLYPSKQILDGYRQTVVYTKDGLSLAGIVRGETAGELTLVDAEGKKHTVRKADVEDRRLTDKSLMPDGLNTGLSAAEFADLIAYLESLKDRPPDPARR